MHSPSALMLEAEDAIPVECGKVLELDILKLYSFNMGDSENNDRR